MRAFFLFWCYNKSMLDNYRNSAILSVKEYVNGIAKLDRLPNESTEDYNKRRKQYITRSKKSKKETKK